MEGYHDFIVDARGQVNRVGDEEVRVVIIAPSGKKTAAKVKTIGDGTYDVGYVLKEVGEYRPNSSNFLHALYRSDSDF